MFLRKNKSFQITFWLIVFCFVTIKTTAQNDYFYPKTGNFDPKIPSPEQFLGYPIGSHFTRHDMIVAYFKELARVSDKVHVQTIGKTYEERPQITATITTPENFARLETIRQNHLAAIDPSTPPAKRLWHAPAHRDSPSQTRRSTPSSPPSPRNISMTRRPCLR